MMNFSSAGSVDGGEVVGNGRRQYYCSDERGG